MMRQLERSFSCGAWIVLLSSLATACVADAPVAEELGSAWEVREPGAGEPDAGEPDMGELDIGAPDIGAPDIGAPDIGAPDIGAPDIGAPDIGDPDIGDPESCDRDLAPFGGGDGSPAEPYRICTPAQMMRIGQDAYRDLHFALYDDLDFSEQIFDSSTGIAYEAFSGLLDGRDFRIENYTHIAPDADDVGLFAMISGEVRNLHLVNVDIQGDYDVGTLAVVNTGIIRDCSVQGRVQSSEGQVGGLVMRNEVSGEIISSESDVELTVRRGDSIGGLVGDNRGVIADSESRGSIFSSSYLREVGGLVGWQSGNGVLSGSHAQVDVTIEGQAYTIGGLVGRVSDGSSVDSCSAQGRVWARYGSQVGGLVGRASSSLGENSPLHITASEAHGAVKGSFDVGGLIGWASSSGGVGSPVQITTSEAHGTVEGSGNVGGLIGRASSGEDVIMHIFATDTHATGAVMGRENVGGLVGFLQRARIERGTASGIVEGVSHVGGLFGNADSHAVVESSAHGDVISTLATFAGGLGGSSMSGTVTDSYATGNVTGFNHLAGLIYAVEDGSSVQRCYSTGEVHAPSVSAEVSGLVGLLSSDAGATVTASYWNTTTSLMTESTAGQGLSAAEFTDATNFEGWDFQNVWEMSAAEGRPVLRSE